MVDDFIEECRKLEADYYSIKPLGLWPEGDENYEKIMVRDYLIPRSEHPISRHDLDENGNIVYFRKPGMCQGVKHTYIASGGEVLPCWYIVIKAPIMGNAVDEKFVDIWKSEKFVKYRDKMLNDWANPLCKKCIGVPSRRKFVKIH
jgi:radical SAM protein with 4Fe4S-binding SPASM domain